MRKVVNLTGLVLLSLLALGIVFTGCGCPTPAPSPAPVPASSPAPKSAQEKVFEIKFGHHFAAVHQVHKVATRWAEIVNRESQGRIKVTVYPAGVLAKSEALYDAILKGVQDVGYPAISFTPEHFPFSSVLELPFVLPNSIVGKEVANGPLFDKYLAKDYENVKLLAIAPIAPMQFVSRKPIRKVEDLKGLKIRVTGGWQVPVFEALGATPVKLPAQDSYEILQRGTVDVSFLSYGTGASYKLFEVARYMTEVNCVSVLMFHAMNRELWQKLPRDLQLVIEYASKDLSDWAAWEYCNDDIGGKQKFIEAKSEAIVLPPEEMSKMRAAAQAYIKKWVEDMKAKGLPGQEVYEYMMSQPELYGVR